eukprot:6482438-Amphidinium_carterae.1
MTKTLTATPRAHHITRKSTRSKDAPKGMEHYIPEPEISQTLKKSANVKKFEQQEVRKTSVCKEGSLAAQ